MLSQTNTDLFPFCFAISSGGSHLEGKEGAARARSFAHADHWTFIAEQPDRLHWP